MTAAAQHVYEVFTSNPDLVTALPGSMQWELAPENVQLPFGVFSLTKSPPVTKDLRGNYRVLIFVFAENLTDAAEISEVIETEVPKSWKLELIQSGYTATDAKEAYIELNFNFKL